MPLRDDLLDPIPGESPSGVNLRYDPVTDKIKEARREDIDAPQGEWKTALKMADYGQVIKLASDALAKKGKDLQIAVWLVDAHIRKEGITAIAPCFRFLLDLLEQYWDILYPEIDEDGDMEVRAAPLSWLGGILRLPSAKGVESLGFLPIVSNKLSWHKYKESRAVGYETDPDKQETRQEAIKEGKITAEEFDAAADTTSVATLRETYKQLNESLTALEALSEFCDNKFGEVTPSFVHTREALDEIGQTVRIILSKKPGGLEEEAPALDDDMSVGVAEDVTAAAAEAVEQAEEKAVRAPVGEFAAQLASVCRAMRAKDPEDPTPYLILRSFAFGPIMFQAPMLDRSAIEAPESDLRVRLKRLTGDQEWNKVLDLTEATMVRPCGRYWMDLQRYAVNAIEQNNSPGISRVVISQLRWILEMQPDLMELTLPDDTPSANEETKNWLENFVVRQVVPRDEPASGESADSSSSDTSSDYSTDTSSDSTPTDESTSLDTSSWDSTPAEPTPEPQADSSAFDLPPLVLDDNPPILEAELPPPSDTSDEFGQALQAIREGRTADGLGMITSILATERSGRQRFRRRTQLAHLLMVAGKGKVAQPLLDQLVNEIEERRLEDWEPSEAMAYPIELLMHCLTSGDEERRAQLYSRICKLDPLRAVNCSV